MEKQEKPEITKTPQFICMACLFIVILAIFNGPAGAIGSPNLSKSVNTIAKNVLQSSSNYQQAKLTLRELEVQQAQNTAQEYMQSLLTQHYSMMWSLLHPQIQAKWPNEKAFASFLQNRFKEYTLQSFILGNVRELRFWVDSETMIQYTQLEEMPVSLQLFPKVTSFQGAALPPEDLHPSQLFQNLPIIMKYAANQDGKGGNWFILRGGPADLEAPILPPIAPTNKIIQVPILMYHHISPSISANPLSNYVLRWVVPPENFNLQMDYLEMHHYHTITFNQLFDAIYYGAPLPSKPIILTFDDGDADQYQYAYPILWAHHFSAMFYIITGWVGEADSMTWSQLGEMRVHGMQIGSHTVHHYDLAQWLNISEQVVQQELQQSQLTLEKHFGIAIQQFCYPYGDPFNRGTWPQRQQIMAMLAADGYVGATTAFGMTGSMQGSMYPFALLRIPVYGNEWFLSFAASLPWN